jgi:transposase InsO family protein
MRGPRREPWLVSSITMVAGRYSRMSFLIARSVSGLFSRPRISLTPQSNGLSGPTKRTNANPRGDAETARQALGSVEPVDALVFVLRHKRPRRNKAARLRQPKRLVNAMNEIWSMDFVSDALFDGRRLRALTVLENYSCECLAIDVGQSLKGEDVVRTLERIKVERGLPRTIKVDNVLNAIAAASFGNKHPVGARWCVDDLKEQVLHNPVVFRSASGGLA